MISAQELGRWRKCGQLDTKESGLPSPCLAVGKSLCESASVRPTAVRNTDPPICGGHIDRRIERPLEPWCAPGLASVRSGSFRWRAGGFARRHFVTPQPAISSYTNGVRHGGRVSVADALPHASVQPIAAQRASIRWGAGIALPGLCVCIVQCNELTGLPAGTCVDYFRCMQSTVQNGVARRRAALDKKYRP
jgi:hypothetical protein